MKVKLLGHNITIKDGCTLDNPTWVGSWSWGHMRISLREGLTKEQRDDALIHEVIEAINSICELDLPHPTLTTLASCLHSFHVQNKLPLFGGKLDREDG